MDRKFRENLMERNVQEEQCYKILEVKIRFLNQKNVEKSRDESFREDSRDTGGNISGK